MRYVLALVVGLTIALSGTLVNATGGCGYDKWQNPLPCPTQTPKVTPSATPKSSPTPTTTASPSASPTPTVTQTPSPSPTATGSPTPGATPTATPQPSPAPQGPPVDVPPVDQCAGHLGIGNQYCDPPGDECQIILTNGRVNEPCDSGGEPVGPNPPPAGPTVPPVLSPCNLALLAFIQGKLSVGEALAICSGGPLPRELPRFLPKAGA